MKKLFSMILLAVSCSVFADDELVLTVNNSEPSFVVSLPANPTTGFQWSVEQFDKDLFTLTSSNYKRPQTQLIGAGGTMVYTFSLKEGKTYPNQSKMVFKYARSWETNSATIKKVTINFVEPAESGNN